MPPTRAERFEALFRAHYPAVRAYALRRAPDDVAQDVAAEAFLVAWRRLDDVPADALPWLYGVTRRVLANERRSAGRRAALAERAAETAVPAGDPGDRLGDAQLVRAALAQLSDRHRETLMLVAWEGLSGSRAARAAGCSAATFAVRLHRGRARLAALLAAQEASTEPLEVSP
jgi:RNA polymerase sigma factor (sigma-70 family)